MAYYFSAPVMKLMFVGLLFGVSNSLSSGLVQSLVANHAPKSKGNTVLSLLRTVQDVGPLVGSLFSGVLLDGLGFGATSVLFGLLALPTVSWRGFLCLRRSSARRWGTYSLWLMQRRSFRAVLTMPSLLSPRWGAPSSYRLRPWHAAQPVC